MTEKQDVTALPLEGRDSLLALLRRDIDTELDRYDDLWTNETKRIDPNYGRIVQIEAHTNGLRWVREQLDRLAPYRSLSAKDPLEGANCALCGGTADNFHVSDDLWEGVGLGQVQACFKCFRIAAWNAGLRPETAWEVTLG